MIAIGTTRTRQSMRFLAIALALSLLPAHSLAQVRGERFMAPANTPVPRLPAPELAPPPSSGVLHQLLRLVGGAAAGAWVGFMASQVAVSDWEDHAGIERNNWVAGGAAFGLAVGLTLPNGGRAVPSPEAPPDRGRSILTTEEIRRSRAASLYEVIRSLRPEWLRTRGTESIRETPRGRSTGAGPGDVVIQPGIPTIRVYLDDSLLGDVDALRDVQPGLVGEARFLDRAEATQRWGAGHLHGAIHVITAPAG